MALTPSTMLALGTPCPDFSLESCEGKTVSRDDFASARGLLVVFMCNHCPYVKHIREGLAAFAREYQSKGLAIVGINSNDFTQEKYAGDNPEAMRAEATAAGYVFPYLVDRSQEVAKVFTAACTPDLFLFDRSKKLVYRGQFDASRPGNGIAVTGSDLRRAADAVLANRAIEGEQRPSIGCNIKWREGNEPPYAK